MTVPPFHNPVRVRFGAGALDALAEVAGGRRTIILTTEGMARRGTLSDVQRALGSDVAATHTDVAPLPTIRSCTDAYSTLRSSQPELIVALGGGSVLDTAKAVAAQFGAAAEPGWLAEHLRGDEPLPEPFRPPPIVAIPTTAGTGSEVTMWGTIWDDETGTKASISDPRLYPEAALLEPALTVSVPRETTVAAALDALSHAMEAIWNRSANPVSDAVAVRALAIIPTALPKVLERPADAEARTAMFSASLLAGLAISSTKTALAHSMSYPLTAELGLPHGIAASFTLPELLTEVAEVAPDRALVIARALGADGVTEAAEALRRLFRAAGTAEVLRRHVPTPDVLRELRGGLIAPGRAENFVAPLTQDAAARLLRRAYEVATD